MPYLPAVWIGRYPFSPENSRYMERKGYSIIHPIIHEYSFDDKWDATHLPEEQVDYIFSSHALEHIEDRVRVLDYWTSILKIGGVLFLYFPHPEQQYWRPWADTKQQHILYPQDIIDYLKYSGYKNIFNGERDLNHSFSVMGEK